MERKIQSRHERVVQPLQSVQFRVKHVESGLVLKQRKLIDFLDRIPEVICKENGRSESD